MPERPERDESVVQTWKKRLRRQAVVSRLNLFAVIGVLALMFVSRGAGHKMTQGARQVVGALMFAFLGYIVFAFLFSFIGLRCPKCNAQQGGGFAGRGPIARPRACRACKTPFV